MKTLVFTLFLICAIIIVLAPFVLIVMWAYKKADIPLGPETNWFAKCRPGKFMGVLLGGDISKWLSNVNGLSIKGKEGMFTYNEGDDPTIKLIESENEEEGGKIGHLPKRFYEALNQPPKRTSLAMSGIHWIWFKPVGGILKKMSRWLEWVEVLSDEKKDKKETGKSNQILAQRVKLREEFIWDFSIGMQVLMVALDIEAGKADPVTTGGKKMIGDLVAEKIALDFYAVFTVYILCPYKAVIIADWVKALKAEWEAVCTDYAKAHSVDQAFMKEHLDTEVIDKLFQSNPKLLQKYGFVIGNIQYEGAGFSGDNEKFRDASGMAWMAQQEAAAIKTKADASAYEILTKATATGKANRLEIAGLLKNPEMGKALLWQRAVSGHKGPLFLGKGSGNGMLIQDTAEKEPAPVPTTKEGVKK